MAAINGGQMNFIVTQIRIPKTIIWAIRVALMLTGKPFL
jgi:hypothetical protein